MPPLPMRNPRWDASSGNLIRTFRGYSDWVTSVAFSPGGDRVVRAVGILLRNCWDTASGGLLRTFQVHVRRVTSIAFAPVGDRVLSGSEDKTINNYQAKVDVWTR